MTARLAGPNAQGTLLGPTTTKERVTSIDVMRGFALFGILLVNMAFFNTSIYSLLGGLDPWTGAIDRAAIWLVHFLAEGKFYSLFSFLFGLGVAIQMERAEARGVPFVPLYLRRLAVLLVLGLVHAFLIWIGDILATYALLGVVLLLFRRRSPKALLTWAAVLLAIPLLLGVAGTVALEIGRSVPEAATEIDRSFAGTIADYEARDAAARRVYADGSFLEITAQRAADLAFFYPFYLIFVGPSIVAMFLLGLYAGRRGILRHPRAHEALIRRVLVWGLGIGLIGSLIYAITSEGSSRMIPSVIGTVGALGLGIGAPALALGYAAAIALLMQRDDWQQRLAPLAAVGRMALSNYLLQSLVCTLIFNGYGLGLYGQVGPAAGLLLAVAIYLCQIPLSVWWMRRFQFGPVEWLWRSLTYGRPQPMRAPALSSR